MKKKIVAILLVLVIVLGAAMAFADEAQLRYIPCPVSGRHQMYGCGQGYMHPGAKGANEGTRTGPYNLYQCNQCGLFLLCTSWPTNGGYLGSYAVRSPGEVGCFYYAGVLITAEFYNNWDGYDAYVMDHDILAGMQFH